MSHGDSTLLDATAEACLKGETEWAIRASDTLCARCKEGQVMRRRGRRDVTVYCHAVGRVVPSDITECTRYKVHGTLEMFDMREIALPVDGRIGVNDKSYR